MASEAVIVRAKAEFVGFIKSLLRAPVAVCDPVYRRHFPDAVETVPAEYKEGPPISSRHQSNEPLGFFVGGRVPNTRRYPFVIESGSFGGRSYVFGMIISRAQVNQSSDP